MNKLKWWQGDVYERRRINEAAAELAVMDAVTEGQGQQLRRLFELDREQGREIARLQAAVGVLMELLIERGVLEEGALRARLDAALAAQDAQQAEAAATPSQRQVTCPVCRRQVAARNTFITVDGEICDQCYYASQGAP